METTQQPLAAEPGMAIDWPEAGQAEVLPKCDADVQGRWVCLTHREWFPNNFGMHSHTFEGHHVVAWGCSAHGIEQP